tara:strand:- start:3085 stop:4155 length:1071 start_codon:yes stop_codon:yes gene_type:complete
VDAVEKRLVVGALDTGDCQVGQQFTSHFESIDSEDIDASVIEVNDFESGLDDLSSGKLDILAVPVSETLGFTDSISDRGCQIIGARTPRRPSLVLVSPNRLMYQPKSAIIVSDSVLVRRQLLRARSDLNVISPEEAREEFQGSKLTEDASERASWWGTLLSQGEIDGFVISRDEYETSDQSERRHSLLPFPQERGAPHFLPKPYSDLIAIVCRAGFPSRMTQLVTEPEGNTVLWVQSRIMEDLSESFGETIGIQVRHRQIGGLLRQAEKERDILLEQACHDPDGEIIEDEVRVEIRIEAISEDGRRTLALDRLVARRDYQHATISLLMDWGRLVKEASRSVPRDHPTDQEAPPFLQ